MDEGTKSYIKSWPLLLVTVVLGVAAAWSFAEEGNSTASIASFCAALIFGGAWLATSVIEWHDRLHKGGKEHGEDTDAR
jgi:heme/copper-type cytochrome/quinol oxidase subunit 3